VAEKDVLNIKPDTTLITDRSTLSPTNASPNISVRSADVTITRIVEEVSVPKMCIGPNSRRQNNNAFWEEFWEKRREWGFSWISGAFTDSMNLAQGCCNDRMEFRTIILNLQYEVSTVILY
jgi:hypothetical protein